jgi:hypothetical protein
MVKHFVIVPRVLSTFLAQRASVRNMKHYISIYTALMYGYIVTLLKEVYPTELYQY